MTAVQPTLDRLTHANGLIIILVGIAVLTAACSAAPQPISPTAPRIAPESTSRPATVLSQTSTPDPCTGWSCTLSGTVYSGTADSGQELAEATVILNHNSYCSPTTGRYTVTTQSDGKFAFHVYLHDTDSFFFRAEKAGAQPVEKKFGGFDCLYCSCEPLDLVLSLSSTAALQALPQLSEAAEAWHLLNTQGQRVWSGWGASRIPFLIRAGEYDLLSGHPAPPPEFSLLPDVTLADQPVYRYRGHLVPVPAATTWEVAGIWSVAVPTREEFQQAIDAQLGVGVVKLDTASYVRTIVHESFHAFTMVETQGQVPDFGADFDEAQLIQQLTARPDLDQQHAAEGQALVKALQATDDQVAREAAAEFLRLRQARRTSDQAVIVYEQTTEWLEGLARYAEISLMQLAGQETYTAPDNALGNAIEYPTDTEVWQQFLDQLANPAASPDGFRGRYYLLGAGQAFLLDRLRPDWKTRVFSEKLALEDLLEQAAR